MPNAMNFCVAATGAFVAAIAMPRASMCAPSPRAPSLCAMREKVIFSCSIGRKIVSICASSSFPGPASRLQYRFGAPGTSAFVLPQDASSRRGVAAGDISYSRGGGAYFSFVNHPYRYVVYSVVVNGGASQAQGLVVQKNSRTIAKLDCESASLLDNLQSDLPSVPTDTQGFDAP